MPKLRIKRFYYRNGRIHVEIREVGGRLHGCYRTWYFNCQLTEELRYHHGRLHGISRQWDEIGRLLGSFTMNHGTGTQRYWHNNGQLRLEMDSVNGKFHGRTRINPDWPQYKGQPAGRVAPDNVALERKQHELFIKSLLEKSHAEARQWLNVGKWPALRSLAKFRTTKAALRFVETLYAAGAITVFVAPVYAGKRRKLFADWLLVKLPGAPSKRRALRTLCQDFCNKRNGAMLPEKNFGESHLFLRLA